ncbi:hypothetical protein QBC37DRAFT_454373 [Rhypophila decipiens]|uniref:Uncharacterized protein n=1 Tax=Rhypophila decipiens TaxID=261697 RepID=A0AAN6XY62_9PEZI|nr:hypothetical protein QBC37DRAFT_454373 [Rhypophila decipiens]
MSTSTRLIHGPLTTLFVPPEGCADVAIQYWGPTVSIKDSGPSFKTPTGTGGTITLGPYKPSCFGATDRINSCLPYTKVSSTAPFSPGSVCPKGWTGSATFYPSSYLIKSPGGTDTINQAGGRSRQSDETLIECCPSGLDYVGPIDIGGCSQTSAVGIFTGTICHGNIDVEYTKTVITIDGGNPTAKAVLSWGDVTYTVTQSAVTENVVGLALLHREQDISLFSAFTDKTADGGSSVPSLSPPGPGSESPTDNATGTLSTGSRVGIGVGAALGVLILAVTFWLFFRRMRAKKLAAARRLADEGSTAGKPELDANANVAGTVQRKDVMPELGIESIVGQTTGRGELEGATQTAGVAELGSDGHDSSRAHYHESQQSAVPGAGIAGTRPELLGSGGALVPVELQGQAKVSYNQPDVRPAVLHDNTPVTSGHYSTQEHADPAQGHYSTLEPVPIRDHSGPSTHVAHDDRAERLLTLQQEQERLNVEADYIRHLMAVEAQQRRIQDEIQRLGSLDRPGG